MTMTTLTLKITIKAMTTKSLTTATKTAEKKYDNLKKYIYINKYVLLLLSANLDRLSGFH